MKSFKISFLLLFSFVLITSTACAGWNCKEGKEKPTTEKRNLENFTAIEMNIQGDIKLVVVNESAPKTVEINTNADLIQYITTEIKDGKLIIDSDPCIDPDGDLIFTLTVSNLEKITINGSGDITSEKELSGQELSIQINGSGDVKLPLNFERLKTSINGSGDLELTGKVANADININGSGDVEAEKLETVDADVNINGSGDCNLRVTGNLKATIVGSGDISYSGKPQNVKSNIIGSGNIEGR